MPKVSDMIREDFPFHVILTLLENRTDGGDPSSFFQSWIIIFIITIIGKQRSLEGTSFYDKEERDSGIGTRMKRMEGTLG